MRKSALFLAALLAVTAPAVADAKAKKNKKAKPAAAQVDQNAAGARLTYEAIHQLWVPFESMSKPAATKAPAKKKVASKKKSKKKA